MVTQLLACWTESRKFFVWHKSPRASSWLRARASAASARHDNVSRISSRRCPSASTSQCNGPLASRPTFDAIWATSPWSSANLSLCSAIVSSQICQKARIYISLNSTAFSRSYDRQINNRIFKLKSRFRRLSTSFYLPTGDFATFVQCYRRDIGRYACVGFMHFWKIYNSTCN